MLTIKRHACCRNGLVAQSFIPPYDVRIPYAMETHGVEASLLNHTPSQSVLVAPQEHSKQALQIAGNVLPYMAIVLVYVATQIAAKMKVRPWKEDGSCLDGGGGA